MFKAAQSYILVHYFRHPLASVIFPNAELLEYYAQLIHEWEPAVDDLFGFMDGVLLTSECTSKP